MTMVLDLNGRIGDVRGDEAALLDEAAVEGAPRVPSAVKNTVLTHEFDPVARTTLLPALLVPGQPGWRCNGVAGSGSDHLWTRTNHWNVLVRVRPQQQCKPTIHAPASTSDFVAYIFWPSDTAS